jgi:hypothetical protein
MTKPTRKRASKKQKKSTKRIASPAWDCEDSSLPEGSQDPHTPPAAHNASLSQAPSGSSSQQHQDSALQSQQPISDLRQSQNAKGAPWKPWQDRFLASEVDKLRPFLQPAGPLRKAAWNELAKVLLEDSKALGPESMIDRTGEACRSRFARLLDAQKVRQHLVFMRALLTRSDFQQANDTRSLQKTGTDEEVNGFIEVNHYYSAFGTAILTNPNRFSIDHVSATLIAQKL